MSLRRYFFFFFCQPCYAAILDEAEKQYKGRICGYIGFSAAMEHLIIAGADMLIMPSRYEPCGLPQV
jgi:glycogen synthase